MILQQFPLRKFDDIILTRYYMKLGTEMPSRNYNPTYRSFIFDNTRALMFDLVKDSALIFSKVDINDVISFPVDISKFKMVKGQLVTPEEDLNEIFSYYDTTLKIVDDTTKIVSIYNNSNDAIRKFNTFVQVVGIVDLTVDDVYLIEDDEDLAITIVENHPVLTGTLRIKTW